MNVLHLLQQKIISTNYFLDFVPKILVKKWFLA